MCNAVKGEVPHVCNLLTAQPLHLYRVLHGKRTPTPVDDIPPPAKTKTIPRMVPPADVLTVYRNLLTMEKAGTLLEY